SLHLLGLCSELMREARAGRLTAAALRERRAQYKALRGILLDEVNGVSAHGLLEAMAVTEGYRATVHDPGGMAFQPRIAGYYPDRTSVYRRVIDIVAGVFGSDAALNLTPLLCFNALNCDAPAQWFWYLVEGLESYSEASISGMDAHQVGAVVGIE